MPQKTKFYSWKTNKKSLPKGCEVCVKGETMVLFITGVCPRTCYYCPLSKEVFGKDITFANDWLTGDIQNIIKEVELSSAKGAAITGGDPFSRLDRLVDTIIALKRHFGKNFHIHTYTSLNLINKAALDRLEGAGLDELRFHPDMDDHSLWEKVVIFKEKKYSFDLGIEIPCIPGKEREIKQMIDVFNPYISFINFNEMEISNDETSKVLELGFKTETRKGRSIRGSRKLAMILLKYIETKYPRLKAHYCSIALKYKVQLAKRMQKRAKNVAKKYDVITKGGTIIRGAVYGEKNDLPQILKFLSKTYAIPRDLIEIDSNSNESRILLNPSVVDEAGREMKKKLSKDFKNIKIEIVEEYPTAIN